MDCGGKLRKYDKIIILFNNQTNTFFKIEAPEEKRFVGKTYGTEAINFGGMSYNPKNEIIYVVSFRIVTEVSQSFPTLIYLDVNGTILFLSFKLHYFNH